jgi:hypothetical protein
VPVTLAELKQAIPSDYEVFESTVSNTLTPSFPQWADAKLIIAQTNPRVFKHWDTNDQQRSIVIKKLI